MVIINNGKLVAVDTPDNLSSRFSETSRMYVRVSGEPEQVMKTLRKVKGVNKIELDPSSPANESHGFIISLAKKAEAKKSIPPVIISNNWDLIEMRSMDASLEDIFIQLVTKEDGV